MVTLVTAAGRSGRVLETIMMQAPSSLEAWAPEPSDTGRFHGPKDPTLLVDFEIGRRPRARAEAMRAKAEKLDALESTALPLEERRPFLSVQRETLSSTSLSYRTIEGIDGTRRMLPADEERYRKIVLIRWATGCSIWHAAYLVSDSIDPCPCVPCSKSEGRS